MAKKRTREKGVITVLVALLLTGILSVGTLAIETGRFQAAKTQLNDATISAATSMVAGYNSELYQRYGLLAIDTDHATYGRCADYIEFNSDLAAGYEGNNLATLYDIESLEVEGYYNLTYPAVLKRQILSRAKYNVVLQDYSFNYYNMDYFLASLQSKASYVQEVLQPVTSGGASAGSISDIPSDMQTSLMLLNDVFSKVKRYENEYNVTLSSSAVSSLPSVTGMQEKNPPAEDTAAIDEAVSDAQTVLGVNGSMLASTGTSTYTETDVSVNVSCISSLLGRISTPDKIKNNAVKIANDTKSLVQAINAAINVLGNDKEGNLLMNTYIADFFPNKNYSVEGYNGPAKNTSSSTNFSKACVEYIFSASSSEKTNQQSAYEYVMAIRFLSNLYSTFINSGSLNRSNATSVAAHIAWAYYESFADTELLFRYNATVPLEKYTQILPINDIAKVKSAFSSKDFLKGIKSLGVINDKGEVKIDGIDQTDYRDALAQSLWLVPNSKKLLRVADLIQLEMRYYQQYVQNTSVDFLMKDQNTFCRVKTVGSFNSVLPVISLSSDGAVDGTTFQSIKYVGY